MWRSAGVLFGLLACTSTPSRPATQETSHGAVFRAENYGQLFDSLAATIAKQNVFPRGYVREVGHPWSSDAALLRAEFDHARTRTEALVALAHLEHSLRDAHCELDPPRDLQQRALTLGVSLWVGGSVAAPDVRVARVTSDAARAASIQVGDSVVRVDGAPVADWLRAHPFESSHLAADRALLDATAAIVRATLPWSTATPGTARTLTIQHGGEAARDVRLDFAADSEPDDGPDFDRPVPMASVQCEYGRPIDYGNYRVAKVATNACVYVPTEGPRIPIVRFLSFSYGIEAARSLRMARADHDLIAEALVGAEGVVLDMHANTGGNNPYVFLRWFAAGPWDHPTVVMKTISGLDDGQLAALVFDHAEEARRFREAAARGAPTVQFPFSCLAGPCKGDVPAPGDRVTTAPVALVVGPDCMSSCDVFAMTWARFHLGPILGRQPARAVTYGRLPIHVASVSGDDLGTLRIAVSSTEFSPGEAVEGEPLALDAESPVGFDSRDTWVRDAVREARRRLASERYAVP
jgi:hypothetical protein